jgi:sugar phosphate isomerase/epimerase
LLLRHYGTIDIMIYGYRVVNEHEVGLYPAGLVQISHYRGPGEGIDKMIQLVHACRSQGIRYVIHPLGYFLSDTRDTYRSETMDIMRTIAEHVDLALIIHDERTPWGARLHDTYEKAFRNALEELSSLCTVSIENAGDTHDIKWFWQLFATSVTLDIGHLEAAGIDSIRFINELEIDIINKINYVHLHRYNGLHWSGLKDHWSLLKDCKELRALKVLLQRKEDVGVILEINDMENLKESLALLEKL